jgi:hypothetical protein
MENTNIIYNSLRENYNITITKKDLANILSSSVSFIDKCIMKGQNLPNYKKLGSSKNSKVIFNLWDVAEFLTATTKIY